MARLKNSRPSHQNGFQIVSTGKRDMISNQTYFEIAIFSRFTSLFKVLVENYCQQFNFIERTCTINGKLFEIHWLTLIFTFLMKQDTFKFLTFETIGKKS